MGGSQLKQLKASLHERGRLGPTPSKKQKKEQQEARRRAKLAPTPEAAPTKKAKFDFLNGSDRNGSNKDSVAKERREQARRDGILFEMQRKQKVGGIIDRRFGEDDPTMTPEERAMERFVREKQRPGRKSGVFDLEDDDDDVGGALTHMGRPLGLKDDFQDFVSDEDDGSGEERERSKKRRRLSNEDDDDEDDAETPEIAQPDRPKSKKEVMEEVIAKSKLYKHERQKAKEDDDDLRAELDAGVADIFALMGGRKAPAKTVDATPIPMNADRLALLNGDDRQKADREYDMRLRAMMQDKRSQPTTRTKTEEEIAAEQATQLQRLEKQRQRRMRGEVSDDDEEQDDVDGDADFYGDVDGSIQQPTLVNGERTQPRMLNRRLDVEDEDEFELDDDLIANDSDVDALMSDGNSMTEEEETDDEDDEFIADLLTTNDKGRLELKSNLKQTNSGTNAVRVDLAYTYSCPQDLEELISLTKNIPYADLPTVVQRIRALYHPQLQEGNKDRLACFAASLVAFIGYLPRHSQRPPFIVLESLIRHIHSLAKSYSENVSEAFRDQLRTIQKARSSALDAGDLVVLTAIGSIYPTSDHFHQVVTPATLTLTRYLEHAIPTTLPQLSTGIYICSLALNYQKLSMRYIPEVVNYMLNAMAMLAPTAPAQPFGLYPPHPSDQILRIKGSAASQAELSALSFWKTIDDATDRSDAEKIKIGLLNALLELVANVTVRWSNKSSFPEIMAPFCTALTHLSSKVALAKLPSQLQKLVKNTKKAVESSISKSVQARKPLALHNHRPLAIKMSIPKFEESYNPDKRYDPDTERAESSKLRAEHKKERKAVIREFRKEARAEASVQLEEKKARDEAYEKKYKRLVAEIQGEEGREAKIYEREKAARKGKS